MNTQLFSQQTCECSDGHCGSHRDMSVSTLDIIPDFRVAFTSAVATPELNQGESSEKCRSFSVK